VFAVAFKFAQLSLLWGILAFILFFGAGVGLIASLAASKNPALLPKTAEITSESLDRNVSGFRKVQPVYGALIVAWFYSWWRLAV
jgi:hypothetical protein